MSKVGQGHKTDDDDDTEAAAKGGLLKLCPKKTKDSRLDEVCEGLLARRTSVNCTADCIESDPSRRLLPLSRSARLGTPRSMVSFYIIYGGDFFQYRDRLDLVHLD